MRLADELKEFVTLLNSREVEFIIVGAYALGLHKLPRYTGDVDIFVRNSSDNAARIVAAIGEFGFASLGLTRADFESDDMVVQLGVEPNRIDILTRISGLDFDEAWQKRESGSLDGVQVCFLSASHLIRNKTAAGRPKDIADVERLKRRMRKFDV